MVPSTESAIVLFLLSVLGISLNYASLQFPEIPNKYGKLNKKGRL